MAINSARSIFPALKPRDSFRVPDFFDPLSVAGIIGKSCPCLSKEMLTFHDGLGASYLLTFLFLFCFLCSTSPLSFVSFEREGGQRARCGGGGSGAVIEEQEHGYHIVRCVEHKVR